jgi:hypothetical protein
MKVLLMKVYRDADARSDICAPLSRQAMRSFDEERYLDGRQANYELYTRRQIGDGCSVAEFSGGIVIAERAESCDTAALSPVPLAVALAARLDRAANEAYGNRLRPLWASKWLLLDEQERKPKAEEITAWLANSIRPEDAEAIIDGRLDASMTWLQYVLVDGESAADYREAMRLAQFYYAALDQINLELLELIEQLSAVGGRIDIDRIAARRPRLEMQGMMHNVRLQEDLRAISRPRKQAVEDILSDWEFAELKSTSKDLLKVCGDLIDAKVAQKARNSSLITEIILVSIGAIAVIDVGISMAFSSRAMATDPVLLFDEAGLPWSARWFASTSLDWVMLGAFGFVVLLVGVYGLFKRWHA